VKVEIGRHEQDYESNPLLGFGVAEESSAEWRNFKSPHECPDPNGETGAFPDCAYLSGGRGYAAEHAVGRSARLTMCSGSCGAEDITPHP
jgi:hypothetical protein